MKNKTKLLLFWAVVAQLLSCSSSSRLKKPNRMQPAIQAEIKEPQTGCLHRSNRDIDTYYINLDRSTHRKDVMEAQLRQLDIPAVRVVGSIPKDIYVREMANFTFKNMGNLMLAQTPERASYIVDVLHGNFVRMKPGYHDHTNTPKELACYISHLLAIYHAVHSSNCSRYALILEDDIYFAYDINFETLLDLAPSPPWGTLQLFSNNAYMVNDRFKMFKNNSGTLFEVRLPQDEWWSKGATIIDKLYWRNMLEKLMYKGSDGKFHFKVIATVRRRKKWKCVPYMCCTNDKFRHELPCFRSQSGFQADMILYEYLRTYVIRFPLFNIYPNLAMQSNIQDQKTKEQQIDFNADIATTINSIVESFYNGSFQLPSNKIVQKFPSMFTMRNIEES